MAMIYQATNAYGLTDVTTHFTLGKSGTQPHADLLEYFHSIKSNPTLVSFGMQMKPLDVILSRLPLGGVRNDTYLL